MSRLLGLALLLAVVATPLMPRSILAQDATPCPPLTEEEATTFATTLFGAWNAHDTDAIVALHAPDAVYHWGIGVDSEGVEEIATAQDAFFAAFPSIHVTVDKVWLAGDSVIVRYISIGNQETEFRGIPPSRETVTWTGISVFQLDCGKIVEVWSEADHFGRIEQQGVITVAPAAEATPTA
jgi:steroid delta-isomerase-like uncharacterized protein